MQEKPKKKKKIVIVLITIIILLLIGISFLVFKIRDFYKTGAILERASAEYTETLKNIPIEVTYNEEKYVIEGLPEEVSITFAGKKSKIKKILENKEQKIELDLSDYEASDEWQTIKLQYANAEDVDYKIEPNRIKIKIEKKESLLKKVVLDNIKEKLDESLIIQSIEASKEEVVVKGSASSLEKIDVVTVDLDYEGLEINAGGQYSLDKFPLIALDKEGNQVQNIEIFPETIEIYLILMDKYDIFTKTIKKNIVVKNLAKGLHANLVSSSDWEVEIKVKGSEEALKNIKEEEINAYVDLKNLKEGEYELPVKVEWVDKNIKCTIDQSIKVKIT